MKNIKRMIANKIKNRLKNNSVVFVDGYPKVGKTTFIKELAGTYMDFDDPLTRQRILSVAFWEQSLDYPVVIDHVDHESVGFQKLTALFSHQSLPMGAVIVVMTTIGAIDESVTLYPYTIEERDIGSERGIHLSQLPMLDKSSMCDYVTKKTLDDYIEAIFTSSRASFCQHAQRRMRVEVKTWLQEVIDQSGVYKKEELRTWLETYATVSGTSIPLKVMRQYCNKSLSRPTLNHYQSYLSQQVIRPLEAMRDIGREEYQIKQPRHFMIDTLEMTLMLKLTPAKLNKYKEPKIMTKNSHILRQLLLTFIYPTILTIASLEEAKIGYYEDYRQTQQIDFIIENEQHGFLIALQCLDEIISLTPMQQWQERHSHKPWYMIILTLENHAYIKDHAFYIPISLLRF